MPAEANEAQAWSQLETTLTAFLGRSYDFFFSRFFFGGYRADAADVTPRQSEGFHHRARLS